MLVSAGDLGILINFGSNEPGDVLQRWEHDGWRGVWLDRKLITYPFEYETLPPLTEATVVDLRRNLNHSWH
jgi:hypothetical protein